MIMFLLYMIILNLTIIGKYYKFKNLKTKLIEVLSEEDYNLLDYLHTNFLFDRIVCKQNNKVQVVYSIRVDSDCHSFTANGIINHNTEAKLNKLAEADLEGTLANAVDMVPNYSETLEEPVVLPGQFPALLCNGTYGIAVGYTSNIPSHQLGEVLDGIIAYIQNNDITIDKLMQIIPGPDFSTGASLINNEEIKKLYETGKGSLKFRAKYHIETEDDLTSIIIDELPPKVNKPQLVEKLRDICLINKKIPRVLSVNDLSTTNTKIVIELAKTAIPDLVIKSIFDLTDLSKSVSYIMRAIHNNRPIIFTLKQALEFYVEHRRNCLLRENQTKLDKANKKRHAMQGLIALTNNIKKAISIIENAEDDTFAKEQLKTFFQLDDEQVEAILEVKLRRLTKLNRDDILNNIQNLDNDITLYNARKDDQSLIDELIIQQCNLLKEKFNDTRRTEIINFEETEEIQEEAHDVILILTNKNTIKVLTPDDYAEALRQGILKEKNEIYLKYISVRSNDMFIIILEDGNYIKTTFNDLIAWNSKIKIINVYPVNDVTEEQDILLMTTLGLVQKIKVSGFKARQNKPTNLFKNWIENDKLIFSMLTDTNNKNVISLITKKGLLHRFYESSLKETVSTGKNGVNAINLSDDIIADVCISSEDSSYIIIYTKHDNGYGRKIVTADSFTVKARNGKGIASITFAKKNPGYVYGFTIVNDAYIDIDNKGKLQLVDIKNLELGSRTSKPDMIDYDPLKINFMS